MTLRDRDFCAALLDPERAVPEGLQNPDGGAASKRFDVYRNNVAASLTDALEAAFPVLHKLVGDRFFRAMAGVYLRAHPPETPLMMFYGTAMPAFLEGFAPARSLPYLPDIARLELAMRHAYHAADASPIAPDALAALAPEALDDVRLRLAPAMQVLVSPHPVHAIYLANTEDAAPKPLMQPEAVLITRPQFDPEIHLISHATARCIMALAAGQTLGQAFDDDSCDPGAVIGLLLGQSAITKIIERQD